MTSERGERSGPTSRTGGGPRGHRRTPRARPSRARGPGRRPRPRRRQRMSACRARRDERAGQPAAGAARWRPERAGRPHVGPPSATGNRSERIRALAGSADVRSSPATRTRPPRRQARPPTPGPRRPGSDRRRGARDRGGSRSDRAGRCSSLARPGGSSRASPRAPRLGPATHHDDMVGGALRQIVDDRPDDRIDRDGSGQPLEDRAKFSASARRALRGRPPRCDGGSPRERRSRPPPRGSSRARRPR
jgi:hypothetical protein